VVIFFSHNNTVRRRPLRCSVQSSSQRIFSSLGSINSTIALAVSSAPSHICVELTHHPGPGIDGRGRRDRRYGRSNRQGRRDPRCARAFGVNRRLPQKPLSRRLHHVSLNEGSDFCAARTEADDHARRRISLVDGHIFLAAGRPDLSDEIQAAWLARPAANRPGSLGRLAWQKHGTGITLAIGRADRTIRRSQKTSFELGSAVRQCSACNGWYNGTRDLLAAQARRV
jgi:hypothetical protein